MTEFPWATEIVRHLEFATAVVVLAALLSMCLRGNRAAIRYWVWFAASVNFLLPLGLLVRAGRAAELLFTSRQIELLPEKVPEVIQQIVWPIAYAPVMVAGAPAAIRHAVLFPEIAAVWGCGSLLLLFRWGCKLRRIRRAVRAATPYGLIGQTPILVTTDLLEPGVYGAFRPVLLLPAAIRGRLPEKQLSAIVAHEFCHVRRRDNLLYLVHLVAETVFWFHPLVWWIGSRLLEEREHACDEATVLAGNDATVYAESILNSCRCCLRAAPAWMAGISGADLKNRVTRIVQGDTGEKLSWVKMGLLSVAGAVVLALPFGVGVVSGAQVQAVASSAQATAGDLRFEVATVKPGQPSPRGSGFFLEGRRLEVINTKLEHMIAFAYGLQQNQIVGAPDWMEKEQFDITAVPEGDKQPTQAEWKVMMQNLLADRFALRSHHDQRVMPVFLLTVSKGGARLKESEADPNAPAMVFFPGKWGTLVGRNAGIKDFVVQIQSTVLDRPVLDKTELTGRYDFTLTWTPDESQFARVDETRVSAASDSANSLPLFTAVQEQLGLKFESTKAPADVIVIDRIEKPGAN